MAKYLFIYRWSDGLLLHAALCVGMEVSKIPRLQVNHEA